MRYRGAHGFGVLGAFLALICCSSGYRPHQIATLKYTVEVRSASGTAMAGYPILATTKSLYLDPGSRVSLTDQEGRIEVVERRTPDPSNPFQWVAPVRRREGFRFYLPEVHTEGTYSVVFVMDDTDPEWATIERDRMLVPPERVEPATGPNPGEATRIRAHGALYFSQTGTYVSTEILADGKDRRRVPLTQMGYGIGPVPREPMLEVTARAAPLVDERGYELHVVIALLDAPDRTQPRAELFAELRALLDHVAAAPPGEVVDVRALDISLLPGATRSELLEALGQPDYCIEKEVLGEGGNTRPIVPCRPGNDDLVYSFYRLPANSLGGGPELHLTFGDGGKCNASHWIHTQ